MKIRRFLILLGLLGLIVLIFSSFGNPRTIVTAFTKVHWYVVPLVLAVQLVSYFCNTKYYQAFFAIFGNRIPFRRLYESALAINFANQALPSGGVSGAAFLTQSVKSYDVPSGRAALAQLGRYGFTFLSFFAVIAMGFVMLFFTNDLDKVSVRLVIFLMYVILTIGVIVVMVFSERRRLQTFIKGPVRAINYLGRTIFRRSQPVVTPAKLDNFLDELYHGYHEITSHRRHWPALLGWTLGGNLAEVLTVYAVFVGFGYWVNPGIVITGYALAIAASVGGALIGGLGVYEAGMIGAFAALGLPFALSFAVVIVYRVLNMGIFLPVGLYYYRRQLQESA